MLRTVSIIAFATGTFQAAFSQDNGVKGDFEYGQHLAAECVTCHSTIGKDKGIPAITGWVAADFIAVVNAYKSKQLENQTMQTIAGRLDDEQVASLAVYFASLPKDE